MSLNSHVKHDNVAIDAFVWNVCVGTNPGVYFRLNSKLDMFKCELSTKRHEVSCRKINSKVVYNMSNNETQSSVSDSKSSSSESRSMSSNEESIDSEKVETMRTLKDVERLSSDDGFDTWNDFRDDFISSSDSDASENEELFDSKELSYDVILTHMFADFDSLGAAVGLARLHGGKAIVVNPGGESPSVRRFLALHRSLLPIGSYKSIPSEARIRTLCIVDTQRVERLGPVAVDLISRSDRVLVFDHHVGAVCNIVHRNLVLHVEKVGSVCTLVVERLMDASAIAAETEVSAERSESGLSVGQNLQSNAQISAVEATLMVS
mmetsp:Transcript_10048/g.18115  ORF Transcript_10048/g.18115 Transcript_10048/m.18115 type:complete len:321 (-) Transcript_10048:1710-2672(-)